MPYSPIVTLSILVNASCKTLKLNNCYQCCRHGSNVRLDTFGRTEVTGSADPALCGELGPPSPLTAMPRGFREDGSSRDNNRSKSTLLDSFWR